ISRDYIKGLLAEKDRIRSVVSSKIMDELHSDVVEGRNLVFEELVCRYVQKILETDLGFLRTYGKSSFRILGLERKKEKTIEGFRFKGYIDRLDSFDEGSVRIVDYKTGKVEKEDIDINDANADKIVAKLFGGNNKDRPKIALQLYLYDVLMDGDPAARGKRTLNCIYQTTNIFVEQPLEIPRSEVFSSLMEERLSALLSEIRDKGTPWRRTDDVDTCKYCDFKTICGK
ncbi:MAG: PD-(D/E)XK nuclease family protein, partial [Bacteroidales bacterium]|nr:PD-(D/E)XK nuclease family protein [Bacteroidales bacterium]